MLSSLAFILVFAANGTAGSETVSAWSSLDKAHAHTCDAFEQLTADILGPEVRHDQSWSEPTTPLTNDAAQRLVALVQAYPGPSAAYHATLEAAMRATQGANGAGLSPQLDACAQLTYLRVTHSLARRGANALNNTTLRESLANAILVNAKRDMARPTSLLAVMETVEILHSISQAGIFGDKLPADYFTKTKEQAEKQRISILENARQATTPWQEELRQTDVARQELSSTLNQLR